ncbi:nuclear transport factor 2 family protein [Salipaludibacillus sp. LMS25]|jgi:ketosteroid isomerase-like protein|uniref:YybH family protein n=1 Tax=Salipaludibacillus sp. LMS25 TaxID=2924031 RepID=UPI0020D1EB3C|nr:nuclear transport factor 2 family protein [Salipaludibacillus sp. LMS25]UTR15927.1 nuclear transport factor 2 family protein [Salipaludibacillus sp. LMS25]
MTYQSALEAYIKATNSHQFEEVAQVLHPEAVYWFTDKTCTTHEDIQQYFEQAWHIVKNEIYEAKDVMWLTATDTTAVCTYTYKYEGYIEGRFVTGSGRATNVFVVDESGDWKLIHEHLSPLP